MLSHGTVKSTEGILSQAVKDIHHYCHQFTQHPLIELNTSQFQDFHQNLEFGSGASRLPAFWLPLRRRTYDVYYGYVTYLNYFNRFRSKATSPSISRYTLSDTEVGSHTAADFPEVRFQGCWLHHRLPLSLSSSILKTYRRAGARVHPHAAADVQHPPKAADARRAGQHE